MYHCTRCDDCAMHGPMHGAMMAVHRLGEDSVGYQEK
jgi:hypothetical protein